MSNEDFTFPKVQLHLHLDGAIRHSTLLELANAKGISLGGARTVEEVKRVICTHQPANLSKVLAAFDIFIPCIVGDPIAIERVAYELCEDQAQNNVIYFEARYSPHLLSNMTEHLTWTKEQIFHASGPINSTQVVEAVHRGLTRGSADFGVKCNQILCCIQGYEQYNEEVLDLAIKFKNHGVVAVDVAGCAHGADEKYDATVVHVFKEAASHGICRTVHAGESGGPTSVVRAIEDMHTMRIGHGYHLLMDEAAYAKYALPGVIHFEGCPYSSIMTGSCTADWTQHPLKRWAKDKISFSISTDDPTCFDNSMTSELRLAAHEIGLTIEEIKQCQINAAKAAFISEEEKAELLQKLQSAFGGKSCLLF